MKQKSAGFGVVEVIIVIVAVAIVGVGGWYVYDKNTQTSSKNHQENSEVSHKKPKQDKEKEAASKNNAKSNLIVVKEWGISMPNNASGTLSYKLSPDSNSLEFISSDLPTPGNDNCDESLGIGLKRFEHKPTGNSRYAGIEPKAVIDGYYYYVDAAPGACGDLAAERLSEAEKAVDNIKKTQ